MSSLKKNQWGVGHLGALLVVVVIAAAAGVGWFVYNRQKNSPKTPEQKAIQQALKGATCPSVSDKDLCKFYKSAAAATFTSMRSSTTAKDGKVSTLVMEMQGTDNTHMVMAGEGLNYETITIANTTYTKDTTDNKWWKQTSTTPSTSETNTSEEFKSEFKEPTSTTDTKLPTYKKVSTEKCGKLTCFKYEVTDPSAAAGTKEYIWFDTKDFQLRRAQTVTTDSTSDVTFGYDKVTVSAPASSQVKELGPNQVIIPGQSEPMTLPSAGDTSSTGTGMTEEQLQQLMQQFESTTTQ